MNGLVSIALVALSATSPILEKEPTPQVCAKEVGATATAHRLADLPPSVRDHLISRVKTLGGKLADSDAPLLETDAPSENERGYAHERFEQGMLVADTWFVQVKQGMSAGVLTSSYRRQQDGTFAFLPTHNFRGPACASIKAALSGVTTPQGL